MESSSNRKSVSRSLFYLLLILLILYFSGSALYVLMPFNTSVGLICLPAFVSGFWIVRKLVSDGGKVRGSGLVYLLLLLLILINSLIYVENLKFNFFIICLVTFAYGITLKYDRKIVFKTIAYSAFVIALVTIVCTFLVRNTSFFDFMPEMKSINGWTYKTVYFFNYIPVIKERVLGPFWEPGVLSSFLSYGLICYICEIQKKFRVVDAVYYTVVLWCIFLSTSSAGYVLAVLCIALFFVRTAKTDTVLHQLWRFFIILALIVVLLSAESIIEKLGLLNNEYTAKLMFSSVSSSGRYLAFGRNMSGWIRHPFFGYGLTGAQANGFYDLSTPTYLMTLFGIGGILYTYMLVKGVFKWNGINNYMKLLILVIIIAIVCKEPHHYNLTTWIILFSLFNESTFTLHGENYDFR